ncbi:hypothetical protein [Rhodospirillum centenum]|uniref:Uncharacterized protein n=1 Tax=Rhodospirillum centenum (strain ATCC 51521 / SW) TaxID=414684 RepID=B6IW81_RHOCS|nr:hypothetical protein [Rhodospirillum centenum]ACJ00555.1 hypothetical protein RC1_3192 [Rhodospirillum centenum SW]
MPVTVVVMNAGEAAEIRIRLVDEFSGAPLPGVVLTLTPSGVSVKLALASVTTDKEGTAVLGRGSFAAVQFKLSFDLPGYYVTGERFVPGPYTSSAVAAPLEKSIALTVGLAPLVPTLPGDAATVATGVLTTQKLIRVGVDVGPNLGNQAAALLLLRNLRRLGYAGPIEVLLDPDPTLDHFELTGLAILATPRGNDDAGCCTAVANACATAAGLVPTRVQTKTGTDPLQVEVVFTDNTNGEEHYDKPFLQAIFTNLPACSSFVGTTPAGQKYGWNRPLENPPMDPARVCFTVRIESVAEISVRDKVALLDPGYATNPLYGKNTSFVAKPAFDTDPGATPCLGLIAASERSFPETDAYRREILRTPALMLLQPYCWYPHLRCLCADGRPPWPLPLPLDTAYLIDPIEPQDYGAILDGLADKGVAAFLDAFVAAALKGKGKGAICPMTVYGIHQAPDPAVALTNILAGLAAVAKGAELPAPAVPLVISKMDVAPVVQQCGGRPVALTDPQALAILTEILETGPGASLVVFHTPPALPQPVFQILVQISRFPVILEGANTANLVQMLATPYLSVKTTYTPYPVIPGGEKAVTALNALTAVVTDPGLSDRPEDLAMLAGYFRDCCIYGSAFGNYFGTVRDRARTDGLDELLLALFCFHNAMQ